MLEAKQIMALFGELNEALAEAGEKGEVGIVGGAVMCLVYNARAATKDVDAIFEPKALLRKCVAKIAERHGLAPDWLHDAAKGFIEGSFKRQKVVEFSNLRVWAPEARYMLAMKCLAARWDGSDREDVKFLIKFLKLKKAKDVFELLVHYYPNAAVPAKTKFFIEELME